LGNLWGFFPPKRLFLGGPSKGSGPKTRATYKLGISFLGRIPLTNSKFPSLKPKGIFFPLGFLKKEPKTTKGPRGFPSQRVLWAQRQGILALIWGKGGKLNFFPYSTRGFWFWRIPFPFGGGLNPKQGSPQGGRKEQTLGEREEIPGRISFPF